MVEAGKARVKNKGKNGTKTSTLALGKKTRYAPKTPATAPDAPSIGISELERNRYWTKKPTVPEKR